MGQIILVTGGAKSGKSAFAEGLAERSAAERGGRPGYIATGQAFDEEMAERIRRHRERRDGRWLTFEEPLAPSRVIAGEASACSAILLDCLTVLAGNIILERSLDWDAPDAKSLREIEERVMAEMRALADAVAHFPGPCVLVANEVGFGVVPPTPLGRFFRDCAGAASQYLAGKAHAVYLVAAGLPLALKQNGEPVCRPFS